MGVVLCSIEVAVEISKNMLRRQLFGYCQGAFAQKRKKDAPRLIFKIGVYLLIDTK